MAAPAAASAGAEEAAAKAVAAEGAANDLALLLALASAPVDRDLAEEVSVALSRTPKLLLLEGL